MNNLNTTLFTFSNIYINETLEDKNLELKTLLNNYNLELEDFVNEYNDEISFTVSGLKNNILKFIDEVIL